MFQMVQRGQEPNMEANELQDQPRDQRQPKALRGIRYGAALLAIPLLFSLVIFHYIPPWSKWSPCMASELVEKCDPIKLTIHGTSEKRCKWFGPDQDGKPKCCYHHILGGLGKECEQENRLNLNLMNNCRDGKANGPLPNVTTTGDTCGFLIEEPTSQDFGHYEGYIYGSPEPDVKKDFDRNYLKCVIGIKHTCFAVKFCVGFFVFFFLICLLTYLLPYLLTYCR